MKPSLADIAPPIEGDTSQYGESRILAEILRRLGITEGLCLEVGAGDGLHLSNTSFLWRSGWDALLIESDAFLFEQLASHAGFHLYIVNAEITPTGDDSIDSLIAQHGITESPEVISIDIDGPDHAVFEAMQARPRVLIIEHHPGIPPWVSYVGEEGASALALCELAERKGYTLVAASHCNLLFVRTSDAPLFDDVETDLARLFDPSSVVFALSDVRGESYRLIGEWPWGRGEEVT